MKPRICFRVLAVLCVLNLVGPVGAELGVVDQDGQAPAVVDWEKEWALYDDYAISIDTAGYRLPTALAFVPEPGDGPEDPLYFVTELRGTVKVVTNDRTVHTFAETFITSEFGDEIGGAAEFGLAGICLDPARGYVFITFTYQDEQKLLRNNIVRFETKPMEFSVTPSGMTEFTDVFSPYESGPSHQIGPCRVVDETLFVGIGDGWRSPEESQNVDLMLGKIVRLTLDGKPAPGNPFAATQSEVSGAEAEGGAAPYVWAMGLRNPFSMSVVGSRLLVADNGLKVDRFLEVEKGRNYLWDGRDSSIASNALHVMSPSVGPVQMDYHTVDRDIFPVQMRESFYIALSASGGGKRPGVYRIPYSTETGSISKGPGFFITYVGQRPQVLTGLAFGQDGMYLTPMMPIADGTGAVLKVSHEPGHRHQVTMAALRKDRELLREKGCFGCHKMQKVFEQGGTKGPILDRGEGPMVPRIATRLESPTYREYLVNLDAIDRPPMSDYKAARREVLEAQGLAQVRKWLKYHVLEPRFANPNSIMPNVGLSESEAEAIAAYLTSEIERKVDWKERVKAFLPAPNYTTMVLAAGLGFVLAFPVLGIWRRLFKGRPVNRGA